jgi:hypothetical protein
MGVISNTGLIHRQSIMKMIQTSIDNAAAMEQAQTQTATDPLQQQMQQVGMQYQIAKGQAEIAELGARTRLQNAKAANEVMEPQFRQVELATKGIYQVAADQQDRALKNRLALVDRAIEVEDIQSNERIARIQSGGSVRAEGLKSAGALASEAVRARAAERKARIDGAANVLGERQKAKGQAHAARHDAIGTVHAARHQAIGTVHAARHDAHAKVAAERTKAEFQGSQARVTE